MTKVTSPIPILPDRPNWSSEIGRFIINFGTLDYRIFEFLDEQMSPEDFVKVRKMPFGDRLLKIAHCLADAKHTEEQRALFKQFAERIEGIRELRNHIAHGFMLLRGDDQKRFMLELCKTRDIYDELLPNSTRLDFEALRKANATLDELNEKFDHATGQPEPRKTTFHFSAPLEQ